MAEGIRKRHSKRCSARDGGRCNCNAGWEASVYLANQDRRITRTFARRSEATSWRADAKRAAEHDGAADNGTDDARTLSEALTEFVAGMRTGAVRPKGRERYKPNTIRSYERALRVHIEGSAVAEIAVGELRRRDLQDFADDLGQRLSAGTVSNVLNPIQAFYRREINRDRLTYNPSERIDLPNGHSSRPRQIASPGEAAALLAALDPADRPVWATAFYAGLRRGELQALRARDIDLESNLIAVERGWDQVEGVIEPKSRASWRRIPLLAVLREFLVEHLRRTGHGGEELIFGRTVTEAFYASTVDYRAKRAWRAANAREREAAESEGREPDLLRPITLHRCRHTFASLLIDSGANAKAVQEFMGHSKIQTTFDVYGHLLPGSHDEVRTRMDAYLRRGESGGPTA